MQKQWVGLVAKRLGEDQNREGLPYHREYPRDEYEQKEALEDGNELNPPTELLCLMYRVMEAEADGVANQKAVISLVWGSEPSWTKTLAIVRHDGALGIRSRSAA